jgi:hypothetical protein
MDKRFRFKSLVAAAFFGEISTGELQTVLTSFEVLAKAAKQKRPPRPRAKSQAPLKK